MKVLILLFFSGLAFGAIVPSSKLEVRNDVANFHAVLNELIPLDSNPVEPIKVNDWLSDLIKDILGIDVVELLNLINSTLVGSDKLVVTAVSQLQAIMQEVSAEIKQELDKIINEGIAEALEIMEPILSQMEKILPEINTAAGVRSKQAIGTDIGIQLSISDIIKAILGITLEDLLTGITDAMYLLTDVLNQTLAKLLAVAERVSQSVAAKLNEVIEDTLYEAQKLVKPLLDMLAQIFPLRKSLLAQLIEAFFSLNFPAIATESAIAFPKLGQIGHEFFIEIRDIFANARPEWREEVRVILENARIEGGIIMTKFFKILSELTQTNPKLKIALSNEELINLLLNTMKEIDQLVKETNARLLEVANRIGGETAAKVQAAVEKASMATDLALKPLYFLVKPFLDVLSGQPPAPALPAPAPAAAKSNF